MMAIAAVAQAAPEATWLTKSHDFGAFDEDMGKVSCDFKVVNTGDEPLMILAARATCGCTVPAYTRDPIAPGDTATITVTYDPAGRPGKFTKKIHVDTNTEPSRMTLAIKGVVIGATNTLRARFPIEVGPLKLRNTMVPFGEIAKGRVKTAFLDAYNQSPDTIYPSVSNLPDYIKVDAAPAAVPPGEQMTFTFFYDSSRSDDWGLCTDEIIILSDNETPVTMPVSLTAILNEDFSKLTPEQREKAPRIALSTNAVDFEEMSRDKIHTAEVIVDNFGKEPLIIRKAYSVDPAVTVKVNKDKIKNGGQGKIEIKVDPSKSADELLNARVIIITNDPDRPQSTVRVVGEYID